jgi:hypothetical protein
MILFFYGNVRRHARVHVHSYFLGKLILLHERTVCRYAGIFVRSLEEPVKAVSSVSSDLISFELLFNRYQLAGTS